MTKFDYDKFVEFINTKYKRKFTNIINSIRYFNEWNTGLYSTGNDEIDKHYFAYILATGYHETAGKLIPLREYGLGKGHKYGLVNARGVSYYGRGDVQLTWDYNYQKFTKILGIDIYNNPDLVLDPTVSIKIIFKGMVMGYFTGKKLSDYFTPSKIDPIMARLIVNGIPKGSVLPDKAELIKSHYDIFLQGLFQLT